MRLAIVRVVVLTFVASLAASACVPFADTLAGGGASDPRGDNPALDRVEHAQPRH